MQDQSRCAQSHAGIGVLGGFAIRGLPQFISIRTCRPIEQFGKENVRILKLLRDAVQKKDGIDKMCSSRNYIIKKYI